MSKTSAIDTPIYKELLRVLKAAQTPISGRKVYASLQPHFQATFTIAQVTSRLQNYSKSNCKNISVLEKRVTGFRAAVYGYVADIANWWDRRDYLHTQSGYQTHLELREARAVPNVETEKVSLLDQYLEQALLTSQRCLHIKLATCPWEHLYVIHAYDNTHIKLAQHTSYAKTFLVRKSDVESVRMS